MQEWLHFIATELHKGFGPINNPKAGEDLKHALKERLLHRFDVLAKAVAERPFLLGEKFTVADGYAYYVLRSLRRLDAAAFEARPALVAYFNRVSARPAVQAALQAEGLT